MKEILTNDKIFCIFNNELYKVIYVTKKEALLLPEPVKDSDMNISIASWEFFRLIHGNRQEVNKKLIAKKVAEAL